MPGDGIGPVLDPAGFSQCLQAATDASFVLEGQIERLAQFEQLIDRQRTTVQRCEDLHVPGRYEPTRVCACHAPALSVASSPFLCFQIRLHGT